MSTRVLHLTLHRRWFDAIASGEKREEYRALTPFWTRRLADRQYDEIHFRNGYARDAPFMRVRFLGCQPGQWQEQPAYVIRLGEILELRR